MVPSPAASAPRPRLRTSDEPALIRVVAGAPGSGNSTVAALLMARLRAAGRPVPALLDKDTVYGDFVAAALASAGRPPGEREGDWYDRHVKAHEYAGLTATAREISAYGCPVLLSGPFTGQIRDPERWATWIRELGGGPVELLYVRSDRSTLAARLRERASDRDGTKLAEFDAFLARMTPDVPPPVPHRLVDNRAGAPALDDQLATLLGST